MRASSQRAQGGPGGTLRHPHTFSTRRRLIAAFSVVLAVFLSALLAETAALRRMEETFGDMKDHEQQMRLALELEDAVRDQYAHQEHFALGDGTRLAEYEKAKARALDLGRRLTAKLDEPDTIAWMQEIRAAANELDLRFREQVVPALQGDDRGALLAHDRSYPLVSVIERNVDRIFARLQGVASSFRAELVSLEALALRRTLALMVAMPLFVAAAVYYLARSVARPLARLSVGAAAVASGDLDARIDVESPDEFGALAAEFNRMTVALKQHQERLVEAEKLASIGRLAAGVAHEINNPLQVVIGYLSLNRDLPDRRVAAQLEAAEAEALRCKQIVDGLLELSRPAVTPTSVDLRGLCDDVAAGLRVSVHPAAARVSIEGAALARGDASKLRQVVFNLMKNAVEAAGPGGEVGVRIGAPGPLHVELAVEDSGSGIPPEARARMFEPFFTTKSAGTGLGLAVSRAIALAHGGDIEVKNGNPGGAVFTLRLPRAPEARSSP